MIDKVLGAFKYIRARFNEPSTHASLAVVFASIGQHYNAGIINDWMNVLTILFGTLGFFVKEANALTKLDDK